jgi:hypothetical protein
MEMEVTGGKGKRKGEKGGKVWKREGGKRRERKREGEIGE